MLSYKIPKHSKVILPYAEHQIQKAYVEWLSPFTLQLGFYAVVHLKKSVSNNAGTHTWLSPAEIEKTARLIRDWVLYDLLGPAQARKNKISPFIPWISSFERGQENGLPHLNILTSNETGLSEERFEAIFKNAIKKLDWVKSIWIQPVSFGNEATHNRSVDYTLKYGAEAFLPSASFVPANRAVLPLNEVL